MKQAQFSAGRDSEWSKELEKEQTECQMKKEME